MEMHPVSSTSIRAIGHEGETLVIAFTSGATYRYEGVSAETYAAFLAAPSIGKFFAEKIRLGGYAHSKVS